MRKVSRNKKGILRWTSVKRQNEMHRKEKIEAHRMRQEPHEPGYLAASGLEGDPALAETES